MYPSLAFVCVLFVCSGVCDCRKLERDNEISPSTDDGCVVDNVVHMVGQQWTTLGECMLFTCHHGGAYGAVTCPQIHFREDSGCYETDMDNTKHYPDCCPQVVCPEQNQALE
ncbi:U-scoloptoxin(16)-Er13a-like [Macrosteles quadrilineatus]|uniref:U-scoloptoxin(16)-Er13a-like n=1 Tax=Macrosteles quadrilineatus TaxID=74068 RepID=UPI0023E1EA60|nr:U-scoloptoxin(16)-Er13a-like [Macrosteles quadrilineatus]